MDDQARRAPKKTNATMVEAFQKRWANHSSFKTGDADRSGHPTFTVHHFNGPVTYSSESFLERNLDALNPDFVSLFRGTSDGVESPGSINPFVKGLFSAKAIATQAHPRNEDTIVSAQQPVKPMRAPSTRRKNPRRMPTLREGGEYEDKEDEDITPVNIGSASGGIPCVAGEFRSALDTLFETLDETQPWFVFCVNPNDSQLPNQLEGRSVKGQVRSACLTEVAKRCATFFEVGMTPDEFCERYKEPLDDVGIVEGDSAERVSQAATAFSFGERDVVLGHHKVSFS
jgi:chitin synthase